jgi:hypothetical protein
MASNLIVCFRDDQRLRENDIDIDYSEEVSGPYHLPQVKSINQSIYVNFNVFRDIRSYYYK